MALATQLVVPTAVLRGALSRRALRVTASGTALHLRTSVSAIPLSSTRPFSSSAPAAGSADAAALASTAVSPTAASPSVPLPGRATAAALAAYRDRFATAMPSKVMARTGWRIPVVGYGSDDLGFPVHDRLAMWHVAFTKKGCNMFFVDGDALLRRVQEAAASDAADERARSLAAWEATALRRALLEGEAPGKPAPGRREELLLVVKLAVGTKEGTADQGGRAVTIADLPARAAAVSALLGVDTIDLLTVHVPRDRNAFKPGSDFAALTATVEGSLVDAGAVQYWGVGCETWSPVDTKALESAPAAPAPGALPYSAAFMRDKLVGLSGQPLRALFSAVEAHAGARGGQAGHRLVAVTYPLSFTAPWPLAPALRDAAGKTWCVAQLAASYGMTQFGRAPLDCEVVVPRGGGAGDKQQQQLARVAFRLADAPPQSPSSAAGGAGGAGVPPGSAAAWGRLNEALNAAIHLEEAWDKSVKAAAEEWAGRAGKKRSAEAAAPSSSPSTPPALVGDIVPPADYDSPLLWALKSDMTLAARPDIVLQQGDGAWARILASSLDRLTNLLEWRALRAGKVLPSLGRVVGYTLGCEEAREWAQAYKVTLLDAVAAVDTIVEALHQQQADGAEKLVVTALPGLADTPGLASKVVRAFTLSAGTPIDAVFTEEPDAFAALPRVTDAAVAAAAAAEDKSGAAPTAAHARARGLATAWKYEGQGSSDASAVNAPVLPADQQQPSSRLTFQDVQGALFGGGLPAAISRAAGGVVEGV